MAAIKKILVPTDFSPFASEALDTALGFARQFDAQVTLLYVYQFPVSPMPDMSSFFGSEVTRAIEAAAAASLKRAVSDAQARARQLAELPPPSIDAKLAMGTPALEILNEVDTGKYDLVVMGTHGRTGLKHALIGSVAEKVVRRASCPVLTVRATAASTTPHVSV